MTRDEAQRAAEEWANAWIAKTTGWPPGPLAVLRLFIIDSYLACFDAMTKGEPEAYIVRGTNEDEPSPEEFHWIKEEAEISLADMYRSANFRIVPVRLIICEEKDGKS